MTIRRASLSALLALSMTSAASAASAAPIADRNATPAQGERLTGGLAPAWLVGVVLVVGLGILVLSDDDNDEPVSP